MNKLIGSAAAILLLICLILLFRQSGRIGDLTREVESLKQGQSDIARREGAAEAALPKQLASAMAEAVTNPVFKGTVSFADSKGKVAAMFDPNDGLVLLTPEGERSVFLSGRNGGVLHAGASVSIGSFSVKDPPGISLTADDSGGVEAFSGKDGPTIMLRTDAASGPTFLLGHSIEKDNDPVVTISADDKGSSVQVFAPDTQGRKRSAQIVANAEGSFIGIQKEKEMKGVIAYDDSTPTEKTFASLSSGNHSEVLGDTGLTMLQDKQRVLFLGFEKFGGALQLDSMSGEQRVYENVSEDSDGIIGLFGPNGRSTVIGHSSK